ncbi:glycerol-3-phosphate 1-O-acyltransferase PlsY [Haloferula rosea]|uniref:Glycerol-3-phosphate acyltransferase n=1 Tax=Haloferula rosea TaxID=490093 RepID=A0A934RHW6_9BACT|nr:glycerol-3-phosphate 1-O-acyltransferase PlsY [Haloferula rosea]MBK1828831.1 glycerol-3-phosphate 1-O-acyltransferase PlsY [Haloferula rosea]
MQLWICPVLAFLLGSIPFGLFIARLKGIDIRAHGSGNIGATNVLRVVGKQYGITCLFLDLLKGYIPIVIAINLIQIDGKAIVPHLGFLDGLAMHLPVEKQFTGQLVHVITALCAVLGHNYSPWVGFKGGKGIATSGGVLLGLMPAAVVLLILVWIILFVTTRYVSIASIGAAAALPVLTHIGARFHKNADGISLWEAGTWNKPLFFFSLTIGLLAIWKHRTNIQRLREGTEHRFSRNNTKESS